MISNDLFNKIEDFIDLPADNSLKAIFNKHDWFLENNSERIQRVDWHGYNKTISVFIFIFMQSSSLNAYFY